MASTGKHILLQVAGWILVLIGLAALVLPGPGLLALLAGLAMLATQYEWAERRLAPVRRAALRAAADSVKTWPRILLSTLGAFLLVCLGVYWGVNGPAPAWWPVDDKWWLVGGWGTGATLIASGVLASAMVVYSYLNFRNNDENVPPDLTSTSTTDQLYPTSAKPRPTGNRSRRNTNVRIMRLRKAQRTTWRSGQHHQTDIEQAAQAAGITPQQAVQNMQESMSAQ